jgi:hypothetical protein
MAEHGGPPRETFVARPHALYVESRALSASLIFLALGVLVGLVVFDGRTWSLFGGGSIGQVAAIVGALSAAIVFPIAYWPTTAGPHGWLTANAPRLTPTKRVFDTVGLSLSLAAIVLLSILTVFTLMESAFDGVRLDGLASSMCVGVAASISAYFTYLSGARVSATSLATVFVIFFCGGAVASMLATSDRRWFELNVSALGISVGVAGLTFNLTVALSGVILMVLCDYLVNDIDIFFRRQRHYRPWRTRVIRWSFLGMGASLVVVGLVPVNQSVMVHNIAANALTIIFVLMLVFSRSVVPGFPLMFYVSGWFLIVSLIIAAVLFYPAQYYNLTSYEMVTGVLIFCWIIIFVRTASAARSDSDAQQQAPGDAVSLEDGHRIALHQGTRHGQ